MIYPWIHECMPVCHMHPHTRVQLRTFNATLVINATFTVLIDMVHDPNDSFRKTVPFLNETTKTAVPYVPVGCCRGLCLCELPVWSHES